VILEQVGWSDKYVMEGKIQVANNLIKNGFSLEDISKYSEIPIEKLKDLLRS
jgi:hypothetical protein